MATTRNKAKIESIEKTMTSIEKKDKKTQNRLNAMEGKLEIINQSLTSLLDIKSLMERIMRRDIDVLFGTWLENLENGRR